MPVPSVLWKNYNDWDKRLCTDLLAFFLWWRKIPENLSYDTVWRQSDWSSPETGFLFTKWDHAILTSRKNYILDNFQSVPPAALGLWAGWLRWWGHRLWKNGRWTNFKKHYRNIDQKDDELPKYQGSVGLMESGRANRPIVLIRYIQSV